MPRSDFNLLSNWRSSARVVQVADALCPRDEAMEAVGPDRHHPTRPSLRIANSPTDAVVGGFLQLLEREGIGIGQAAVLAPAWYMLFPIARELRRLGVAVSGPGSRPYNRRGRLLTGLLENVCACIPATRPDLLRRIQFELFTLIQNAVGEARYEVWERPGRLAAVQMIFRGRELKEMHHSAIPWILDASEAFLDVLKQQGLLGERGESTVRDAASSIVTDIRSNRDIDPDDLTVDDIGTFANPDGSMKLLTFHAAKGREFDAVCAIELQEGSFPHPRGDEDKSRRVLYVAVTRPRKVLMLTHRRGSTPCRFLTEAGVRDALDTE